MKKIALSILLVIILSTLSFTVSAETTKKEWTKMTGPAEFSIGSEGVSLTAKEGLTFYKYTKDTVDITDFSCTFSLEQENYWDGHEGEYGYYYYSVILANKAAHSGSQGLFLLLFPTSGRSLRIEGQILNTGFLLSPTYVEFDVDTTSDMVMHCKVIDDKYYEISFDNCKETYKFEIPLNYQFHKELGGKGYFGFGAKTINNDQISMTVSKVNDKDFTGSEEIVESTPSTESQSSNDMPQENSQNVSTNNQNVAGTNVSSAVVFVLVAGLAVLFIIAVGGFVFLTLFINKRLPSSKDRKG